jgi:hypothetical protein
LEERSFNPKELLEAKQITNHTHYRNFVIAVEIAVAFMASALCY